MSAWLGLSVGGEDAGQLAVVGPLIPGKVLAGSHQPEDLSSRGLEVQVRILDVKDPDAEGDDFLPHLLDVVDLQLQVGRLQEAALIQGDAVVLVEDREVEVAA
jgi:hypothetical protein